MEEQIIRVRTPEKGEVLGIVLSLLGGGRLEVKCDDGFTRIGRIPGRMKRKIWVRVGDLVMLKPWEVQSDERGDIIWKYSKAQAIWLEKKGYLKNISIDSF
jgi:translation initiation factor 1A